MNIITRELLHRRNGVRMCCIYKDMGISVKTEIALRCLHCVALDRYPRGIREWVSGHRAIDLGGMGVEICPEQGRENGAS